MLLMRCEDARIGLAKLVGGRQRDAQDRDAHRQLPQVGDTRRPVAARIAAGSSSLHTKHCVRRWLRTRR